MKRIDAYVEYFGFRRGNGSLPQTLYDTGIHTVEPMNERAAIR